jgi:hypothetical protein
VPVRGHRHAPEVTGHGRQQVVVTHSGDVEQRQHDLEARLGPNACAVATPRLSSTTGEGLIRASRRTAR